jgi:hypothetical protein
MRRSIGAQGARKLKRGKHAANKGQNKMNSDKWNGSPCPYDPDNFWIDDETGERVDAETGARIPASVMRRAPDLLAALKAIARRIDLASGSPTWTAKDHDALLALIAKAEGAQ